MARSGLTGKLVARAKSFVRADAALDSILINQGRILSELNRQKHSTDLRDYEFKVFSQFGDDGIIQFLTSNIAVKNRTFIEFGVERFFEANCRFLMIKDNWRGFVVDGSSDNMDALRKSYFFPQHDLNCKAAFITRANVAAILDESGFDRDAGILSIDVDGVDYFLLEELSAWRPSILIVEINPVLSTVRPVTVPYAESFVRRHAHFSNLYYGASLPAFRHLAGHRGYALVGANSAGNNAFFVRRELLNGAVRELEGDLSGRTSLFRESRNAQGELTHLSGAARRAAIADMPVVDVVTGETVKIGDIPQ